MAIEHSSIEITTDDIKTKLLDMEVQIGNAGNAFAAIYKPPAEKSTGELSNVKTFQTNVKSKKSNPNIDNVKCDGCKQISHFKSKCLTKNKLKQQEH